MLLTERGLGGDGVDLTHRLERFGRERGKRADEAHGLARRWAALAGNAGLGRRRRAASGARLSGSGGAAGRRARTVPAGQWPRPASLEETDALAARRYLVVTDITGAAASGRIRGAARDRSRTTIEELFASQIVDEVTMSVRPRHAQRAGAAGAAARGAAARRGAGGDRRPARQRRRRWRRGSRELGIGLLPWTQEQTALRARASYLRATLGEDWPDLSDAGLAADAGWLTPHASSGARRWLRSTADDLGAALEGLLPWAKRQEIERLLPSHFSAPSGSHLPIDYAAENGPALEVRVQELFGLDRHPSVAGGKVPLLLVLLSARRTGRSRRRATCPASGAAAGRTSPRT